MPQGGWNHAVYELFPYQKPFSYPEIQKPKRDNFHFHVLKIRMQIKRLIGINKYLDAVRDLGQV